MLHPKKVKDSDPKLASRLIVDVTRVVCETEAQARMFAARAIPDELYKDRLDEVEIVVRPF